MDTIKVEEIVRALGYHVIPKNNDWWKTSAIYRGGDNISSLCISRRDGHFHDFGLGRGGSLKELVKLTLKIDGDELEKFLQQHEMFENDSIDEIPPESFKLDKIWPASELENLQPHYKFYNNKGISDDTLKFFQSGMSHSGVMNCRYVFPIYNENGQIHGWVGRDMTGRRDAKWKIIGAKKNFVYPAYMQSECCFLSQDAVAQTREIILVESVGDMLSLWDKGIRNTVVTFGLKLSSKICAYILSRPFDRIVIATNNDFHKEDNTGRTGAISMFVQLMNYVDAEKLLICLPQKKDFGEMDVADVQKWLAKKSDFNRKPVYKAVLDYFELMSKARKMHKMQYKTWEILKIKYREVCETQPF